MTTNNIVRETRTAKGIVRVLHDDTDVIVILFTANGLERARTRITGEGLVRMTNTVEDLYLTLI